MNEYEIHETALKRVCKEIEETLDKIEKSGMSDQSLERLDKLYHTKKDILSTWAMEHPEEFYEENQGNMSGARGRSPITGRYVSREGGNSNSSYENGYSRGYSEAMNQMSQAQGNNGGGNSGHLPMNPYYPEQRRW